MICTYKHTTQTRMQVYLQVQRGAMAWFQRSCLLLKHSRHDNQYSIHRANLRSRPAGQVLCLCCQGCWCQLWRILGQHQDLLYHRNTAHGVGPQHCLPCSCSSKQKPHSCGRKGRAHSWITECENPFLLFQASSVSCESFIEITWLSISEIWNGLVYLIASCCRCLCASFCISTSPSDSYVCMHKYTNKYKHRWLTSTHTCLPTEWKKSLASSPTPLSRGLPCHILVSNTTGARKSFYFTTF